MQNDLLESDCPYIGLMGDKEIRRAITSNMLLEIATVDLQRIRQASYELRLSSNVEFLVVDQGNTSQPGAKYERPANGVGDVLHIKPGETLKAYTIESFRLPANVVAHITPVGNVYKLGLSPETTYADPGFDGDFYIVICNYSSRIVDLKVGQPIARVEFVRLTNGTQQPHPGAKKVSEPLLWPRRVERRNLEELRELGIEKLLDELENKDPPHIEHAFIAREVRKQVNQQLGNISIELTRLRRRVAVLQLIGYLLFVIAILWLVGITWNALPENIQGKFTEGVAKEVVTFVTVIPLFFRKVRTTIALALLGKDSLSQK